MNESWYTGPHRPLSDYDRDAIAWMYQDARPLVEIAGGVGRAMGTVKTAIRGLRAVGLVGRRYGCQANV
jgi:predicted transcriptional regulator